MRHSFRRAVHHIGSQSGLAPLAAFGGLDYRRMPDKRTPKEVVRDLGLQVGDTVRCPGGIVRPVRKITNNGDVYVKGMRPSVNVYALEKL